MDLQLFWEKKKFIALSIPLMHTQLVSTVTQVIPMKGRLRNRRISH